MKLKNLIHTSAVVLSGRQRQIFNTEAALKNFSDDDIVFKTRWDVDINKEILENIQKENFFDKIENGIIDNKVWVGFYCYT